MTVSSGIFVPSVVNAKHYGDISVINRLRKVMEFIYEMLEFFLDIALSPTLSFMDVTNLPSFHDHFLLCSQPP